MSVDLVYPTGRVGREDVSAKLKDELIHRLKDYQARIDNADSQVSVSRSELWNHRESLSAIQPDMLGSGDYDVLLADMEKSVASHTALLAEFEDLRPRLKDLSEKYGEDTLQAAQTIFEQVVNSIEEVTNPAKILCWQANLFLVTDEAGSMISFPMAAMTITHAENLFKDTISNTNCRLDKSLLKQKTEIDTRWSMLKSHIYLPGRRSTADYEKARRSTKAIISAVEDPSYRWQLRDPVGRTVDGGAK